MSRTKGHDFERLVAAKFRQLGCEARRSLQAHQPYEPDVVVTYDLDGMSRYVNRLWLECNHADSPNSKVKLTQAVRDIAKAKSKGKHERDLPWVVWRETGRKQIWVTMPAWVLYELGYEVGHAERSDFPVTIEFDEALRLVGLLPAA